MRARLLALLLGLTLPIPVLAVVNVEWSFLGGNVSGQWEVNGWATTTPTEEGVRISANENGYMMRSTGDVRMPIDVVTIEAAASRPVEGALLWRIGDTSEIGAVPFTLNGTGLPEVIHIYPAINGAWEPATKNIGIGLPAGSDVLLRGITLRHWNIYEKFFNSLKSYWTMDEQLPYSINFLWGPLIVTNPYTMKVMFDSSPAIGRSAVWVFLGAIALSLIAAALWKKGRSEASKIGTLSKAGFLVFGVTAGCWAVFQIRMDTEYLNYVKKDLTTYVMQPADKKVLRNFENIYSSAETIKPHLEEGPFVLISSLPVKGMFRYLLHPAYPVEKENVPEGTTSWFVFRDPGATVAGNQLLYKGAVLASSGAVIETFPDGSFLYQTP